MRLRSAKVPNAPAETKAAAEKTKKSRVEKKPKEKKEDKTKAAVANTGDESTQEFVVERIVDTRIRRGKLEYLLKWEGYPDSANTWEPVRNIGMNLVAKYEGKKARDAQQQAAQEQAAAMHATFRSPNGIEMGLVPEKVIGIVRYGLPKDDLGVLTYKDSAEVDLLPMTKIFERDNMVALRYYDNILRHHLEENPPIHDAEPSTSEASESEDPTSKPSTSSPLHTTTKCPFFVCVVAFVIAMLRRPEDDESARFLPESSEDVMVERAPEETSQIAPISDGHGEDADDVLRAAPVRQPLPIEIVVRNINQVVGQPDSSDDSEAEADAVREVNHYLQREGFKVTQKQNGADCEIVTNAGNGAGPSSSATFKKGHRRAWSMPSGHKDKRILAVVDDDEENINCNQRRHIVRYRLHPYKPKEGSTDLHELHAFDETMLPPAEDDDDELEVEINEEEIVCIPGSEAAQKRSRKIARRFWEAKWKAQNFEFLPEWLQDNEFLRTGHRPPLPSFFSCFKSIFSLHTETGNIWTHMYGCVAFMGVALWFLTRPSTLVNSMDKAIFSTFFAGAITCLGMSCAFHTVQCHSVGVGKLFSKLDYTGISLLIVGSFIPWIYYGFYCRRLPMLVYITMISVLGIAAMVVSLWDKFAEPKYRPLRATVFVAMGLSSIVPAIHFFITDGMEMLINQASLHWLVAMGIMYLVGAALYAFRIPERFFPGKCDIWFQSHQLFHTCVIIAAFIHFHGITEVAVKRLEQGSCDEQLYESFGLDHEVSFLDKWIDGTTV